MKIKVPVGTRIRLVKNITSFEHKTTKVFEVVRGSEFVTLEPFQYEDSGSDYDSSVCLFQLVKLSNLNRSYETGYPIAELGFMVYWNSLIFRSTNAIIAPHPYNNPIEAFAREQSSC